MKVGEQTPDGAALAELGRRLEVVRKQLGLSQARLAQEAGLGVATLRRIEDGQDAQLGSWIKLLRALGLSAGLDGLLPESFRSPMADVRGPRRRSRSFTGRGPSEPGPSELGFGDPVWGDETP